MWKLAAIGFITVLGTFPVWSAEKESDPWEKVRNLKTGSDLRIYKTGAAMPVLAKSADVTERKLIVIIKNGETAISKSEIERIDFQPPPHKAVTTKTYDASSDSASMSINRSSSRDGWQTVYQRTPAK